MDVIELDEKILEPSLDDVEIRFRLTPSSSEIEASSKDLLDSFKVQTLSRWDPGNIEVTEFFRTLNVAGKEPRRLLRLKGILPISLAVSISSARFNNVLIPPSNRKQWLCLRTSLAFGFSSK